MSGFALSWTLGFATLITGCVKTQNLAGNWQGTLKTGSEELRVVLTIANTDGGGFKAILFRLDQSLDWGSGAPADTVTIEGTTFKFSVNEWGGTYEGKITEDRNSIVGTWNQTRPLPLEFRRATPATEWKHPAPHSTQLVSVDKGVKLEVIDWGHWQTHRLLGRAREHGAYFR